MSVWLARVSNHATVHSCALLVDRPADVLEFHPGQRLEFRGPSGTRAGYGVVSGVEADPGVLLSESLWSTQVAGLAPGDLIYLYGEDRPCVACGSARGEKIERGDVVLCRDGVRCNAAEARGWEPGGWRR